MTPVGYICTRELPYQALLEEENLGPVEAQYPRVGKCQSPKTGEDGQGAEYPHRGRGKEEEDMGFMEGKYYLNTMGREILFEM